MTTLAAGYADRVQTSPHLAAVRAAVARYGADAVAVGGRRGSLAYLGAAAGLGPAATLVSVSDRPLPWWTAALGELGRRFRPRADVPPCDLIVWDGPGHADAVAAFLSAHAAKAKKAVLLLGVARYAEVSPADSPTAEGILPGVRRFLRADPTWVVPTFDAAGDGVVVVSRDPADRPAVRHGLRDAFAFFKAEAARRLAGGVYLPLPMARGRVDACLTCVHRGGEAGGNCTVCRCFLFQVPETAPVNAGAPGKVFYAHQGCPLGRWAPDPAAAVPMTGEEAAEMLAAAFGPQSPPAPADDSRTA